MPGTVEHTKQAANSMLHWLRHTLHRALIFTRTGSWHVNALGVAGAAMLIWLGWDYASARQLERSQEEFEAVARDSEQALQHRMNTYVTALDGAAALFMTWDEVSADEWERYATTLDLDRTLPGMNGIGFIRPVRREAIPTFVDHARSQGSRMKAIHPASTRPEVYPIKYITPLARNREAVGLDLGFEVNRRNALHQSRDSGQTVITRPITLVQDRQRGTGFLLVRPIYDTNATASFPSERRNALRGWSYAPLLAQQMLTGLSPRQGRAFDLAIYQGSSTSPEMQIYDSASQTQIGDKAEADHISAYTLTRQVRIAGQDWTVHWRSLPEFEQAARSDEPTLVLLGGIAIALCLGALLVSVSRREARVRRNVLAATAELAQRDSERLSMLDELGEKNRMMVLTESVAHVGHWRLHLDAGEVYWSAETFAIHGLPEGRTPPLGQAINLYHQDDRDLVIRSIEKARAKGEDFKFSARLVRPDGSIRHVETRGLAELREDGTVASLFGVMADRTDEVVLRQELTAARDAAETAMRAKSAFLANMSHEIRTPMNGVVGFADLLLRSEMSDAQHQQVQLIAESGKAMTLLLNDILDLSKIEAGELAISSEPVELGHIARHTIRVVEPAAREKNVVLDLRVEADVPSMILGDGLRLRQILINLLGNAVKFTDRGMVSLTVRVMGSTLHFMVQDTGIGIPENLKQDIFDDFVQISTKGARQRGGTGLGLAISSRLAGLMGGTLTVESLVGTGSTFTLSIPLLAAKDRRAAPARTAQPRPDAPLRMGRVLLAEDYDINQMLITAMAEETGIMLDIAADGAMAVEMVATAAAAGEPYALVLMDMQMPVMDGIEATKALRSQGIDADTLPIVALTANAFREDIENCLAAGMQAHCSKPLSMERFEQILRRWLRSGKEPSLIEVAA